MGKDVGNGHTLFNDGTIRNDQGHVVSTVDLSKKDGDTVRVDFAGRVTESLSYPWVPEEKKFPWE